MNSAELIKRMQQRAAARAAAAAAAVSAAAINKPENAQNAPVNQSSGWRRVVDAHAEKTAERATSERCAKCHFAKQADGWCYWQDKGVTEWEHHWIETSTCRAAPVRSEYMTLAQRDDLARVAAERGENGPTMLGRVAAAAAKKALDQEATRLLALEFWAKNQEELEAAGWSEDSCVGLMCRAVEIGAAKVDGEYIIFNKWTKARARQARRE